MNKIQNPIDLSCHDQCGKILKYAFKSPDRIDPIRQEKCQRVHAFLLLQRGLAATEQARTSMRSDFPLPFFAAASLQLREVDVLFLLALSSQLAGATFDPELGIVSVRHARYNIRPTCLRYVCKPGVYIYFKRHTTQVYIYIENLK